MPTKPKQNEIALSREIETLQNKKKNFTITGGPDMVKATEYLSQANQYLDRITTDKEKLTKPINEALKEIRARYKPAELQLSEIISSIRSSMSAYQTLQANLKKVEEIKLLGKIESGKMSLEKGAQKMSQLHEPETKTVTESGSVRFREDKKLKIVDLSMIPREFLVVNERALLEALKAGKSVPGAKIELIQTPVNNR